MNLGELRTAVDQRSGHAMSPSALNAFVSEAAAALSTERDWPWLDATETLNTTKGTGELTPGGTWARTRSLRIADYAPMERFGIVELEDRWPSSSTTGRPSEYAVSGERLELRAVPDGVYAVAHRFVRFQPALLQDTDSPIAPARFHGAIVELALSLVHRRMGEGGAAESCEAAYRRWITRMLDDARRHAGPSRVRLRSRS